MNRIDQLLHREPKSAQRSARFGAELIIQRKVRRLLDLGRSPFCPTFWTPFWPNAGFGIGFVQFRLRGQTRSGRQRRTWGRGSHVNLRIPYATSNGIHIVS